MSANGDFPDLTSPEVTSALTQLGDLERDFAAVELDALRAKEYASKELYAKRGPLLSKIPQFWPMVLTEGPDEFQAILTEADSEILASIKDLQIERYQIKSDTEGEPRSLRFAFTFDTSQHLGAPLFEDEVVVKEFEFITNESLEGGGAFVSKPVNFRWTREGKKKGLNKMLDLACQLYQAEEALVANGKIDEAERQGLWQYEKLREEMEKEEDAAMNGEESGERSFLDWFGYRGAVSISGVSKKSGENGANGDVEGIEDEDEELEDGTLDVEIFPAGEEVAIALAEDLWPNVMDYFMKAQDDDIDDMEFDVEDEDEGDAPNLVEFAGFEDADEDEDSGSRPAKKQRMS